MNFETALKIQKCAMGDEMEFSIGEIAGEAINPEKIVKGMTEEKKAFAMDIIHSYLNDETRKIYTGEAIMDEMDRIRTEIEKALNSDPRLPLFNRMYGAVQGMFMSPPFAGLDGIASGILEVCVYSALEYYAWKKTGFDHEYYRGEFSENLAKKVHPKVVEYWMGVYDRIQEKLTDDMEESSVMVIQAIEAEEPGKSEMTEKDLEFNSKTLKAFLEAQLMGIRS